MKSVLFFLYVVLFSSTIHAKVEVLCLGEGECITVGNNSIHPGSLSHASYQQKLDYLEFLKRNAKQLGLDFEAIIAAIDLKLLADSEGGDVEALNTLNDSLNSLAVLIYDYLSDETKPELPPISDPAPDPPLVEEEEKNQEPDPPLVEEEEKNQEPDPPPVEEEEDVEAESELFIQNALQIKIDEDFIIVNSVNESLLRTEGGNGNGEVTFFVSGGGCVIEGLNLTAPAQEGICIISATKAQDDDYRISNTALKTITVASAECENNPELNENCPGYFSIDGDGCPMGADGLWTGGNMSPLNKGGSKMVDACEPACMPANGLGRAVNWRSCMQSCSCIWTGALDELCEADPSRDPRCPGYYTANFGPIVACKDNIGGDQGKSPLFDSSCPGYTFINNCHRKHMKNVSWCQPYSIRLLLSKYIRSAEGAFTVEGCRKKMSTMSGYPDPGYYRENTEFWDQTERWCGNRVGPGGHSRNFDTELINEEGHAAEQPGIDYNWYSNMAVAEGRCHGGSPGKLSEEIQDAIYKDQDSLALVERVRLAKNDIEELIDEHTQIGNELWWIQNFLTTNKYYSQALIYEENPNCVGSGTYLGIIDGKTKEVPLVYCCAPKNSFWHDPRKCRDTVTSTYENLKSAYQDVNGINLDEMSDSVENLPEIKSCYTYKTEAGFIYRPPIEKNRRINVKEFQELLTEARQSKSILDEKINALEAQHADWIAGPPKKTNWTIIVNGNIQNCSCNVRGRPRNSCNGRNNDRWGTNAQEWLTNCGTAR